MVISESETMSQGEVESPAQGDEAKNPAISSLGRQLSIYSLTLDELQHTLSNGKNFGSMNMDEFLTSIWTAEENQVINSTGGIPLTNAYNNSNNNGDGVRNNVHLSLNGTADKGIATQPNLPRQGSLTLPVPLCRKTVDEVWTEIHKGYHPQNNDSNSAHNSEAAPRQPTFGEMTLEDFLIKAGVVREQGAIPAQPQQQHYGMYQSANPGVGPGLVSRTVIGMGGVSGSPSTYQAVPQGGGLAMAEPSGYAANGKRCAGYSESTQVCYSGRVKNGAAASYGPAPTMIPGPVSPTSDGMGTNQAMMDMGGLRGRKRIIDGPVEKVVERRQRRMIKNRESAARSRARKQAYTVELEAELNQLKEENAHLKQALQAELERKRKQQYFEELKMKAQTRAQKARDKLRAVRRNLSCPL